MKKNWPYTLSLVMMFCALLGMAVFGAGTQDDPLISLSYLEEVVLPDLTSQLQEKFDTLSAQVDQRLDKIEESGVVSEGESYETVEVKAGQTVLGHAGTELIVRIGNAKAVCPGINGLVDATGGLDLANGKAIVNNHVYIIPREDGRGVAFSDDGWIMIKGGYDIE